MKYNLLLSILILSLIYSIITINISNRNFEKAVDQSNLILKKERELAILRDDYLKLALISNETVINEEILLIGDKNKSSFLKEKVDSKKIVFRYSELHCDVCVDEQIKSLKKYKEKIGSDNILILADYDNIKNLILFKRLNSIDIPVYKPSGKLNLELERKDIPYFFVLDSSFIARDFFVPIKEIDGYTDDYLKIMNKKHFQ